MRMPTLHPQSSACVECSVAAAPLLLLHFGRRPRPPDFAVLSPCHTICDAASESLAAAQAKRQDFDFASPHIRDRVADGRVSPSATTRAPERPSAPGSFERPSAEL